MAHQHDVVGGSVQDTPGLVCDWDIAEGMARFEGKLGDDGIGLVQC